MNTPLTNSRSLKYRCRGVLPTLFAVIVAFAPMARAQEILAIWNALPSGTVERNFEVPGVDLSFGGTRDALALEIGLPDRAVLPLITVYSGDDNASDWLCAASTQTTHGAFIAPLRDFVAFKGVGADFAHVTRITVSPQPVHGTRSAAVQLILKAATTLSLEMTYVHLDTEADGEINPGDTLEFSIVIENGGAADATNTVLSISAAEFSSASVVFVPGTVTVDNGVVGIGNLPTDEGFRVDIGYLGVRPCALSTATITFQAQIEVPFDVVGNQVCLVSKALSDNAPLIYSDDPGTPTAGDPTCVEVVIPGAGAPCQNIVLSEGFEGGFFPFDWTTNDVDGAAVNGTVSFVSNAWVAAAESGNPSNGVGVSTSFYTPAATSDDWLISPLLSLPRESRLRWYARAAEAGFRDGYEVRISTTGTAPADFLANPPLFTVAAEEADWQLHILDLGAAGYAYENVYIAWRNTSNDKYLLYVDGIELCDTTPADPPACPGTSLFANIPAPVNGAYYDFTFTGMNTVRLDSFNGLSEPVGQITWWGVEFNGIDGSLCDNPERTFRVELIADDTLADDGTTLGASVFSYTGTVTRTATGRSVRNQFVIGTFFPEYEYTLVLDAPVSIPQGWLLLQSNELASCYFGWLRSPQGDGTGLNAEPSLDPSTIALDAKNGAFCLSPSATNDGVHTVDQDGNSVVSLSELLRVIQFYNIGGLSCANPPSSTEDGYVPGGGGDTSCTPHDTDYLPQNWIISLSELLRNIQFYNIGGYHYCPDENTEDDYCPGL